MRNPATPSGQTIGGIVCVLITFHTQTSKFIINKQPQSLYHTESLDPSVERQGCCVSLGEAEEKKGEVQAVYVAGYGYQLFSYLAVWGFFWERGGEAISKAMLMVHWMLEQRGWKFQGIWQWV